jgi:hypothetical protein
VKDPECDYQIWSLDGGPIWSSGTISHFEFARDPFDRSALNHVPIRHAIAAKVPNTTWLNFRHHGSDRVSPAFFCPILVSSWLQEKTRFHNGIRNRFKITLIHLLSPA